MNKRGRPGWSEKRLMVSFSKVEVDLLESYCLKHNRKQADVIRELVRSLKLED